MRERKIEQVVYEIRLNCAEEDCDGEMVFAGTALLRSPAVYPHVCVDCGYTEDVGRSYPLTVTEPRYEEDRRR